MMMAVIQTERDLDHAAEAAIRREVRDNMGVADSSELMVFAKWVSSHVEDANNVSLRYAKLFQKSLDMEERQQLVAMVARVASVHGEPSQRQLAQIAKLKDRLGL